MFEWLKKLFGGQHEPPVKTDKDPAPPPRESVTYRSPKNKTQMVLDYEKLWNEAFVRPEYVKSVRSEAALCLKGKTAYEDLSKLTHVPWEVLAVIHKMEGACNFKTHLHNGDPLTRRTVQVPKGRPPDGVPPFSWIYSAQDAIFYEAHSLGLDLTKYQFDIANTLFWLESYNGFGYRQRGINSPYLWSYTNQYTRGRYVADGKFDPNSVSKQAGCVSILKELGFKPV